MNKYINYNTIAQSYDETREVEDKVYSIIEMILSPFEQDKILEFGCGTGNYLNRLACSYSTVSLFGIEKSIEMAQIAKQKIKQADIRIGDHIDIPFSSNSFNKIFSIDVIHHINELNIFFANIYNLSCINGLFIICTETDEQLAEKFWNKYFPSLYKKDKNRFHSVKTIINEAGNCGWKYEKKYKIEEEKYSTISDSIMNRIKKRTLSSLFLLSEHEYNMGVKDMEEDYNCHKIIHQKEGYTILIFRKD